MAKAKKSKKAKPRPKPSGSSTVISVWEQDPGSGNSPDGGLLVQQGVPTFKKPPLGFFIENPSGKITPRVYKPGTAEFRYWATAGALNRGTGFWGKILKIQNWKVGPNLPVDLYHGNDLNAYYDRVGLRFFQADVGGRTFYSCESPDVCCHEMGHAVLDTLKPELWDAPFFEAAAFHESFGDMSAILCALQVKSLRQGVLTETGGMFYSSSRLSRLAEQLGWAIRQGHPNDVDGDCLRNAVNSFFYQDPSTLPTYAPASSLSSEPHSFSRVFTAGFYEALANMFKGRSKQDEANLLQAATDLANILAGAINAAAVVPGFYSQVAAHAVDIAGSGYTGLNYAQALRSAFIRHGILSPATNLSVALSPEAAVTASKTNAGTANTAAASNMRLEVSAYQLGMDSILVQGISGQGRFDLTGAGPGAGSIRSISPDDAARHFIESLIRRGRIKVKGDNRKLMHLSSDVIRPNQAKAETHTHELQKQGPDYVLRRVRIDCRF